MAVAQTFDLSPDRIGRLPRWARVAFATRCALRVLPAARPVRADSNDARRQWLLAAQACCFIPVNAAVVADEYYNDVGSGAAAAVIEDLKDVDADSAPPANVCVALVAMLSAGDATPGFEPMEQILAGHARVAGAHQLVERFAHAAGEDLSALETLELLPEARVPLSYFQRPIFGSGGPVPSEWQPVLGEWRALVSRLDIPALDAIYVRATGDGPLSLDDVQSAIRLWMAGDSPLSEAPVTPHEPAAKEDVRPSVEPKGPPDVWMRADRPLEGDFEKQDQFGFTHYAKSLAAVLDHEKTETPFTMAINAPWGAGKSTLANMIVARLEELPKARHHTPHVICRFNAWMHDDAPNLATALVSEVSRTAARHRPWFIRVLKPLPAALLEPAKRKWRRAAWVATVITLTALASWQIGEHLLHLGRPYQSTTTTTRAPDGTITSRTTVESESLLRPAPADAESAGQHIQDEVLRWLQMRVVILGAFLTALAGVIGGVAKMLTSTPLGAFVQSPDKAAETGAIWSARQQLRDLIAQATLRGNRFILFVDDIERCGGTRSVDVLDAVNQLLDHPNVLVVLLGEMSAVAAAAQLKYKDLAEIYVPSAGINLTGPDRGKEAFGRLYIQKIVQLQFDLPLPPKERIRTYMSQLAVTPEAGADGRVTA